LEAFTLINKFIKNIYAPVFIVFLLVSALCNNIQTMAADIEKTGIPAFPVRYTVSVNGQNYILQAFSVDGQDYFKMRDIAFILKDTIMRFDISWHAWENAIHIEPGEYYHAEGAELTLSDIQQAAFPVTSKIFIGIKLSDYPAYFINGNTYMKIADIAEGVGFEAEISPETFSAVIKSAPIGPDSYAVTLVADSNTAYFNGMPINLSAPPVIMNDIFYIPLEPVTKLLGGKFSFESNNATVELFGDIYTYQVGSRSFSVNGETYTVYGSRELFKFPKEFITVDENYVPVIINNTVYIPSQFTAKYDCPYYSVLAGISEYPETRSVILGGFSYKDERGIREVKLEDTYDDLPEYFRESLNYEGIVDEVLDYNIEKYTNYDLEIYVMRLKESSELLKDNMYRFCFTDKQPRS